MQQQRHQRPEDHNRLVIFFVLAAIIMGASYVFITKPAMDQARLRHAQQAEQEAKQLTVPAPTLKIDDIKKVEEVLANQEQAKRIPVDSPQLQGSLSTKGLRFDDLELKSYYTTLTKEENVRLLAPTDTKQTYFVEIGVMPADSGTVVPTHDTVWKIISGDTLSPEAPVIMEWNNGAGLTFRRTVTMDRRYLVTVDQSIRNDTANNVTLYPYALISQSRFPLDKDEKIAFEDKASAIMHIGPVGYLNEKLQEEDFGDVKDEGKFEYSQTQGWLGMASKYWFVSLLPDRDQVFDARFVHQQGDLEQDLYQVDMRAQPIIVLPNETASTEMRFFAGAKKLSILQDYEDQLNVDRLDLAVDFGVLYLLTKPLYYFLSMLGDFFHKEFNMVVSFGMALLVMTVILRGLTFPLQNKAYKSMNRMKDMGPKIHALKEKYGDDKAKFQQEVMGMYKKEKINPASGCLPILLQIPIFFALYKVIFITLDMRHAPFWGWIHDLSAPDPTNLFNLFGLLPFTPPAFLVLGAWPILYGITMWLQQRLNPQPEDETQKMIFGMMPWVFMFVFAAFPAGLVIYYTWSNVLGIIQQYSLRRMNPGTTPPKKPRAKKAKKSDKSEEKTAS